MNKEKQSSYRQIFKATGLFGGVQFIQIIITIIKAKFVAVLLGPGGIGISNLLNTPLGMIGNISGLGISFSAIRDISRANETGDLDKIARTILIFRRWVWFTGLLGACVTLVLARQLSKWSFGNTSYTWSFIWLSCTLLLNAISSGQTTLLRGMRQINKMAKAAVIGSLVGMVTSLPLYYYYGLKGIVPAIIFSSVTALSLSWYFAHTIKTVPVTISYKESFIQGKTMAKLGIMMIISSFINQIVSYLVNIYISHKGGINDVGLYNAGWGITTQYVGLVFTAMGTDYFPRLSAVNNDNNRVRELVNQQAEIAILILAPILLLLLTTAPLVIRLFFSAKFLGTVPFMQWVVLGMLFKASSWAIGFIILAKGNSAMFFITECIANAVLLGCNILGYYFYGITGMGISFLVSYTFYLGFIYFVARHYYTFTYTKTFIKLLSFLWLVCLFAFMLTLVLSQKNQYISGSAIFLAICWFSWKELNKRMDLTSALKGIIKK